MGIGISQEECDNSCDREIRMYQKEEERCRFDKKELKSDSEKYKEEIDELTDKFNDFEAECKKEINKYKNKRVMAKARKGNEIISELQNVTSLSGGNSGLVSINRVVDEPPSEGFDNLDSNKENNNNDNFLLIFVMSIIVVLYICK